MFLTNNSLIFSIIGLIENIKALESLLILQIKKMMLTIPIKIREAEMISGLSLFWKAKNPK